MTSTPSNPDIVQALRNLGLRGLADDLDDLIARATKARLSPLQLLEEVARIETRDRGRRTLESRQKRGKIGALEPMADFDWNWPTHVDRALVELALRLGFMNDGGNVIVVGPNGIGKTMILQNIAHQAILGGHSALFVTAARLINDLGAYDSPRALEQRLKHYAQMSLLCIDEVGYLAYDSRAADLLFEVVSRRHAAKKPIGLSTNLAFKDWGTVFPHATCTVALIDRLMHRADVIRMEGESWRKKEAKERQARPREEAT